MRWTLPVVLGLVLAAPGARAAAPAAAPPGVTVRIQQVEYAVSPAAKDARYAYLKQNPNLAGKDKYVTEAVVLENEHLTAVVVPEFGARLPRVTFKKAKRDLFWTSDVLEDRPPWSIGGSCFSFPQAEYGRHLDEPAGYRIVKGPDGSVTVAMDMRFRQYAGEVQRYGRASALRQATFVTVRPGAAWVEYTARVDNPLPVRCGFRLWNVVHFPRRPGARVLLAADGVTADGAPAMVPWPAWDGVDHSVLGDWGASCAAVDAQGDWAGVYYGDADANHLVIKSRYTAPGVRLCATTVKADPKAPRDRRDGMVEIWSGSAPLLEHPGHYLPPFGAYTMPLRLAMVSGIGRIDWTDGTVALAYEAREGDEGATVRVVAFEVHPRVKVVARTRDETVEAKGALGPDAPLAVRLAKRAEPVQVTVSEDDAEIAKVALPWRPERTAPEAFAALKAQAAARDALAAELADWCCEDGRGLPAAAALLTKDLAAARPDQAAQAARILLRTEAPGSPAWRAGRGVLEGVVRRKPPGPHPYIYLAMMMTLDAAGRPTSEAAEQIEALGKFPGARYLAALRCLGTENPAGALTHLKAAIAQAPNVAMGLEGEGTAGNEYLHPAATLGGEWPDLLRAAVLLAIERPQPAIGAAEALLVTDPARPEALALLAEAYAKAGRADKAREAAAAAENLFRGNDEARKDLERLRREVKTGAWAGFPRP